MHVLPLLKMGAEVLETGEVHVYQPDRERLLAVRKGCSLASSCWS